MRHLWTVTCSRSVVDSETNTISLIDILEEVTVTAPATAFPATIGLSFEIVTLWARDDVERPETGRARATLRSPAGVLQTEDPVGYVVDLTTHLRNRARVRVQGLTIDEGGEYIAGIEREIEGRWEEIFRLPIRIIIRHAAVNPNEMFVHGTPLSS